jgi:hypothetical protein
MDKSRWQEMAATQIGNDGCSGGSWRQWTLTVTDDDDGDGGQQQRRTTKAVDDKPLTTACEIGQRTTRGKEENGRQTTTALDKRLISPPGREREKIKKVSLHKKTFFIDLVCLVDFFAPSKTANVPFLLYQFYMIFSIFHGRFFFAEKIVLKKKNTV